MLRNDKPDALLAAEAQGGSKAAFEDIISRHKDSLYRIARRYSGNADDAYDVLQDALLAAWMSINRFDTSRDLGAWLRTILLNKCRDMSRRQTVRYKLARLIAVFGDSGPLSANNPQPDADPMSEERRLSALDNAIATLPRNYKEPLILTVVAGLSHQEAADQLRITPKAVEMRLRRARKRLGQIIGEVDL